MANVLRILQSIHRNILKFSNEILHNGMGRGHDMTVVPAVAGFPSTPQVQPTHNDSLVSWDGLLLAKGLGGCPKHKPGIERSRKKRFDLRRYYPYLRSRHMYVPCESCGSHHKKYHLCPTCYDQTRFETEKVREKLKESGLELSEETVVQYKDDEGRFNFDSSDKRKVFMADRKRPTGWFSSEFWGR